jgi:hypothetical protein
VGLVEAEIALVAGLFLGVGALGFSLRSPQRARIVGQNKTGCGDPPPFFYAAKDAQDPFPTEKSKLPAPKTSLEIGKERGAISRLI